MRRSMLPVVVSASLVGSLVLFGCTVVPIGQEGTYTGESTFDAARDIDTLWSENVQSEIGGNARDLNGLLGASSLVADDTASQFAGKSLSTSSSAAGNVVVYAVKGAGTVTNVVAKAADSGASSKGYITIALEGYDGPTEVDINVGPVISDTSLRDYLSSINLNDYRDTTEWSQVSKGLNDKAQSEVIDPADIATIKGRRVTFVGAFTANSATMSKITITPIEMVVE
ncbi:DUF2291 domain-containing protein [Olsenella profusa]|uniref:Periplasmic lipoprotein, PF10054 family n=1 Tax=Olsenella profusa F0195 TaxID=1125712 RepID=U2TID8_9ACTN|nr:DUF2291 domain-containing protein [Olsenella profusa]ERL05983.1 periplasmic lipoprotein, PF10054 family [Olsenella profusa F0195]